MIEAHLSGTRSTQPSAQWGGVDDQTGPYQRAGRPIGFADRHRQERALKLITDLYQRWRHLVHEMAKFGIVGAINTVLDFGLANLLYLGLGWPSMGAKTTSVAVAATSSFFMNRHWTFRHRARTRLRREYSLFFLLNGVGLLIAWACILFVEQVLHRTGPLWFNIAQVAGLALGMVFRFTTYKRFVFLSAERAAARSLAEGSVAEVDDSPAQPAGSRTSVSS